MIQKQKLVILLVLFSFFSTLSFAETTYTSSTSMVCNNNTCTKTLYSSIMFADSHGTLIENIKSLKTCEFCSGISLLIEQDPKYPITEKDIIDYNATSITFNTKISTSELNKNIPITVYTKGNLSDKKAETTINFKYADEKKEVTIDFGLDKELHIGEKSTIITLQTADTENLEDTRVYSKYPTTNYESLRFGVGGNETVQMESYIKFNLSSIPNGSTILDSSLNLYIFSSGAVDNGVVFNISIYHVYAYPIYNISNNEWKEEDIIWNNKPNITTQVNNTSEDTLALDENNNTQIVKWNVTKMITNNLADGYNDFTMKLNLSNWTGPNSGNDWIWFDSKEYSNIPYLSITFSYDSPWIRDYNNYPQEPLYLNNVTLQINVSTEDNIIWTNFTLISPNGTRVINNSNGTVFQTDLWNSSSYLIDLEGQWNISVTTSESDGDQAQINWSFTISDDAPYPDNVTISPSPAENTDDLNCTYDYGDNETNPEVGQWFLWWKEGVLTGNTSQILGAGNTTLGDNWTCTVWVSDGLKNSSHVNSSTLYINDTIAPVIEDWHLSNSTGFTTDNITFFVNCSDASSSITYVRVSFANPNGEQVGNKTMIYDTGNMYNYSYIFNIAGVYRNFTFWCLDSSGNLNGTNTSLTFTATSPPTTTIGGGGGGSPIILNVTTFNLLALDGLNISVPLGVPVSFSIQINNTGTVNGYFLPGCEGDPCRWISFVKKQVLVNANGSAILRFDVRVPTNESEIGEVYEFTITGNDVVTDLYYIMNVVKHPLGLDFMFSIVNIPIFGEVEKWMLFIAALIPMVVVYLGLGKTKNKFWLAFIVYIVLGVGIYAI